MPLLVLIHLAAGCTYEVAAVAPATADFGDVHSSMVYRSALMYLSPEPYREIFIEIDAVEGLEPDEEMIQSLVQFLRTHCQKPVRIVLKKPIPRDAAREVSPMALATRRVTGPPTDNVAYIYVLFHHGTGKKAYVLSGYRCAILVPMAGAKPSERWVLARFVLKHEAGHLMGLCRNTAHGDGIHCRNGHCLMLPRATAKWSISRYLLGQDPVTDRGPTDLCGDCKRDILEIKNSGRDCGIEFNGPVLIRNEQGYFVGTLPTHCHLGIRGSPVNWEYIIPQARELSASLQQGQCTTSFSHGFSSQSEYWRHRPSLEAALKDRHPAVRMLAKELMEEMDAKAVLTTVQDDAQ